MDKITVSFKKLKKIGEVLEKSDFKLDDQVAFEFIIGSLFPDIATSIKDALMYQHTEGFIEGLNARIEAEEEEKENITLWNYKEKKELVN